MFAYTGHCQVNVPVRLSGEVTRLVMVVALSLPPPPPLEAAPSGVDSPPEGSGGSDGDVPPPSPAPTTVTIRVEGSPDGKVWVSLMKCVSVKVGTPALLPPLETILPFLKVNAPGVEGAVHLCGNANFGVNS